ncbi:MAG: hypothetical protein FJZ38_08160 [Candidatus Rokubacteria bacterium]|nr:hypothetical protein [Candidatus Rokubacteria bacterium]
MASSFFTSTSRGTPRRNLSTGGFSPAPRSRTASGTRYFTARRVSTACPWLKSFAVDSPASQTFVISTFTATDAPAGTVAS